MCRRACKCFLIASQDNGPRAVVFIKVFQRIVQFLEQGSRKRIQCSRAIESYYKFAEWSADRTSIGCEMGRRFLPRPTPGWGRETSICSYCFIAGCEYDLLKALIGDTGYLRTHGLVMILVAMAESYRHYCSWRTHCGEDIG